ncbi:MAG: rhomboid family intramembrane serine protease [Frankiaceae bacterium]|nr:rhomboid family intramembrane serine protease [Frankiaceae bacterium]
MSEDPQLPPTEAGALVCYRHPDRETGVRCARCERPICPDCMVAASVGFQCPECVREGRRSIRPTKTMYGGRARGSGGEVTKALIGINVAIFLVTLSSGAGIFSGSGGSDIYQRFALIPPAVAHGDWYRLISSMFLHYGLPHLAINMYALWIIGHALESMLGRLRYLVLYFFAGIGGSIFSFAFGPVLGQAAGASGAIFGLFGAFFIILRRRNLEAGGIVAMIAINLVFSFTVPNIDWRGHVGGLVAGALVGYIFAAAPQGPRRDQFQAAGAVAVAVVLAACGFAGAAHVRSECRALAQQTITLC